MRLPDKKLRFVVFSVCFLIFALGMFTIKTWQKNLTKQISTNQNLLISTSFYPLYYFASRIVGDKATVFNITPAGAEPHDYEPTTRDLRQIEQSNLVILHGANLEPWADKIEKSLTSKPVTFIRVGDTISKQVLTEGEQIIKDPHTWLDPLLAISEVRMISKAIQTLDPKNAPVYEKNSQDVIRDLYALDTAMRSGLKNCKQKNIVTSHAAFGYLASEYNLVQIPIAGLSPEDEPTPREIAKIAVIAKANNITHIFFETLVSPRLAQTIASEIGASTIVFNPLEGISTQEQSEGKNYFTIQMDNLKNLRTALQCI